MISLQKVSKSYDSGRTFAVEGVDLHVRPAEFLVIVGETGSGKTTTLKLINGLLRPTSGRIEIFGVDHREVSVKARLGFLPEPENHEALMAYLSNSRLSPNPHRGRDS